MTPLGVLLAIAEGKRRHDWSMQAALMAHIARMIGASDARAQDFDPYAAADEPAEVSMSELRGMFRSAVT